MATQPSRFAPAERAQLSLVQQQAKTLLNIGLLDTLYAAVNESVLILNPQRQIVFYNDHFARLLGCEQKKDVIGKRPGEALGCIHACDVSGCGTSEFCSTCGGVKATLSAQLGKTDIRECQIVFGPHGDPMDLLIRATPLKLEGQNLTIFAATDISDKKRRNALEHIFFHDLMNTATSIQMLSENLRSTEMDKVREVSSNLYQGVLQLVEEITAQRDLVYAENNELPVRPVEIDSKALLAQMLKKYGSLARIRGCALAISEETQGMVFCSDRLIIARVLGNMIQNSLEASTEGQKVTLASQPFQAGVSFSVHNPAYIPRDVQLQLFKRSFSTKGNGRGLGTYSMKLLTERYLGGRITFSSSQEEGTTFTMMLEY
jgi:signal transduction histidine kinase